MSESVDIIIKAEDLATPVVQQSAKAVDGLDASLKKVKESGSQAKKSADFAKIIASSLGGSGIGAYIGQIGEAADKTAQFAEVQKLGGAGAVAFKVGLVGLVGTIAFGVGNAIGNAIFQTERWKKALADATVESARLESQLIALKAVRFSDQKVDIELIRDPDAKKAAYAELFVSVGKEIEGVERRINTGKKAVDAYNASWTPSWIQGNNAASEEKLKTDREGLEVLKKQREETRAETLERQAANKEIEKQNALQDKSDDYLKGLRDEVELLRASKEEQAGILALRNAIGDAAQTEAISLMLEKDAIAANLELKKQEEEAAKKQIADNDAIVKQSAMYTQSLRDQLALLKATDDEKAGVQAGQNTVGADTAEAAGLLSEMDAIKRVAETEKEADAERKRIATEKESDIKRIVALKESELQKLEEERIRLTLGAEAAKAFALEKQGLSKEDANAIAAKQTEVDLIKQNKDDAKKAQDDAKKAQDDAIKKSKEKPEKIKIDDTQLVASESRLLSRGKGDNAGATTAANTATLVQQNSELQQQMRAMNIYLQKIANKREPEFEEVS